MEAIGVLMMCPMNNYLEQELGKRFNLFRYWTHTQPRELLIQQAHSIRAVVGNASASADSKLIDELPKLEIVASFSVGLDKIDLIKCKEKGIRVTNTPDVLTDDVADLAIGLMLSVLRRICECDKYVRKGAWKFGDFKLTTRFTGKRVGIIGLGRIGLAIAKRAEAFDCPISYYSRSEKPNTSYKYHGSVVELASNCDILVVACALTPETTHIVNREVMNALGPKGVLINIGRGPHVDEAEMVSALVEGRLGGAGLDVFEKEPQVPEQLFGLENVVLLPHVGSGTVETRKDMADLVLGNLEAHFSNKSLLTPVLNGKQIGIIGLGRIGSAIAKRAEAFGCTISYNSRTNKQNTSYTYCSNIVDLATKCQILVVACALTEETRCIVNREVIDALGPNGVLINIGRGPHIDELELVSALSEGRLGGAGLDVYEHEPMVPESLFGLDNVVLLSHVGSDTVETCKAMADLVVANLEAHFMNKPLLTQVV